MLETYPKKMLQQETPSLILDYNVQHKQISKIIQRHWHILKNDKDLNNILPELPSIIYRRALIIRDMVVKSVIEPPHQVPYSFSQEKVSFLVEIAMRANMLRNFRAKGWNLQRPPQVRDI